MTGNAVVDGLVIGIGYVHEFDAVGRQGRYRRKDIVAGKRYVLNAFASVGFQVFLNLGFAIRGFVDGYADLAAGACHGA